MRRETLITDHCQMPFTSLIIRDDGSVYCCHLNRQILGNFEQKGIEEIWNGKEMLEVRKKIMQHDYSACDEQCPYVHAFKNRQGS